MELEGRSYQTPKSRTRNRAKGSAPSHGSIDASFKLSDAEEKIDLCDKHKTVNIGAQIHLKRMRGGIRDNKSSSKGKWKESKK